MKNIFARRKTLYTMLISVILLLALGFFAVIFHNPLAKENEFLQNIRMSFLRNPVVIYFLHTYHSFRKLPDIVFAPYYLIPSKLPAYTIYITSENINFLNSNLPDNPISGYLYDENKVWVDAIFIAGGYKEKVQIKYRGTNANHWNSFQKSLRVKFPSEHLFNGMKSFDLIIPYDRGYFAEVLNFYRAQKLGLAVLDMSFARLSLNGVDMGVYIEVERWNEKKLSRSPLPDTLEVFNFGDGVSTDGKNTDATLINIKSRNDNYYFAQNTGLSSGEENLKVFYNILENADDETFKRLAPIIIDLPKLYAFNVVSVLAGSGHFDGSFGNVYLIFNPEKGKFEISPWDLGVRSIGNVFGDQRIELTNRVFSILEFRNARNKLLKSYIENQENLTDDMKFYDGWFEKTKYDFFTDNAKLYNNFQFLKQVRLFRKTLVDNFSAARAVLNYGDKYYMDNSLTAIKRKPLVLKESFSRLLEAGYSIDEFIMNNPFFVKRDTQTVALLPKTYYFQRDIIIPLGVRVVIDPGATLYMGEGISFFSYGSVIARGNNEKPIRVLRAYPNLAWGTFGVVNTENDKSVINNVEFDGGSGDKINGIIFTGMAAFHNADVEITNSIFKNAGDDDALNIKYGNFSVVNSVFTDNYSDGVDIDFSPKNSIVENNRFYNNGRIEGGDTIDLSWSDLLIKDNLIKGCSDKGISVGESSKPIVTSNTIEDCDIGIAVKDSSLAEIRDNVIKNSRIGIAAYQKKQVFGGGTANVINTLFENVKTKYENDGLSEINILK